MGTEETVDGGSMTRIRADVAVRMKTFLTKIGAIIALYGICTLMAKFDNAPARLLSLSCPVLSSLFRIEL